MFGIAQGGLYKDLRIESISRLKEIDFDGYAMGVAVGENQNDMFEILNETTNFLPKNKPRYLMGVGTPSDILGAVKGALTCLVCNTYKIRQNRTSFYLGWKTKFKIQSSNPINLL